MMHFQLTGATSHVTERRQIWGVVGLNQPSCPCDIKYKSQNLEHTSQWKKT